MNETVQRRAFEVESVDGARARLQLHLPHAPRRALYWLPALGVGIGPNEAFADALAAQGIAVALHEWRGLGGSNRRAGRDCDWGYTELLDVDLPGGMAAARAALPGVQWVAGGHSLGGQLALLAAARHGSTDAVFLVASGQPWWRRFPGMRAQGVRLFAHAIGPLTRLVGHFPGRRLGFAGREAARLMRDWATTCLRGDYRIADYGASLDAALAGFSGAVLAIRMAEDRLAPPGAIDRLRELAPCAHWEVRDFGTEQIRARRPDHFGWLRDPQAVAKALADWWPGAAPAAAAR
jgi:predicted alpha/beta hydrolase